MQTSDQGKPSQRIARWLLACFGWQVETPRPALRKYVLVVYPHTSNWDFVWGYLGQMVLRLKLNWMGKDTLFRWPFGTVARWLGGIPVNRRTRNNFIEQMAERFARSDDLVLAITPEGTRARTEGWKSGFYYIAKAADVPVVLGYIDYKRKRMGVSEPFLVTGDVEADMARIREFFADKYGRYPQNAGVIRLLPRSGSAPKS